MQALYAFELGSGQAEHVISTVLKAQIEEEAGLKFATSLFLRALDVSANADEIIERYVKNWDLSRIALVDRILLRMAITEFLAFEDIPPKVSINEAIEIAKKYSTAKSGQFINGILDAVLLDLQREGRLRKSGRGLVGLPPLSDRLTPEPPRS